MEIITHEMERKDNDKVEKYLDYYMVVKKVQVAL